AEAFGFNISAIQATLPMRRVEIPGVSIARVGWVGLEVNLLSGKDAVGKVEASTWHRLRGVKHRAPFGFETFGLSGSAGMPFNIHLSRMSNQSGGSAWQARVCGKGTKQRSFI